MRTSAFAMVLSWLVLAAMTVSRAGAFWPVAGLALVVGFTGLWAAHVVAFFLRSRRLWNQVQAHHRSAEHGAAAGTALETVGQGGGSPSSRRAFFAVTASALAAVVAGPLLGPPRRPAGAQSADCVGNCIERQYNVLRSCLNDCQTTLQGCANASSDPRGCIGAYQSCTVRCTQRVPFAPVREFCESACNRGSTTTSSSTTSSSTTSTTTFDCGPFGCGG